MEKPATIPQVMPWLGDEEAAAASTLTKTDPLLLTETDPASAHVLVVSWPAQPIAGMLQATIPLFDRRDHSSVPTCVPHDMASGGGQ